MEFLNKLLDFFKSDIGNLPVWQFLVVIILGVILILVLKFIGKYFLKGLGTISKGAAVIPRNVITYRKRMMKNTVCPKCGRTLDKCVCPENKDLSLRQRYRKLVLSSKGRTKRSK